MKRHIDVYCRGKLIGTPVVEETPRVGDFIVLESEDGMKDYKISRVVWRSMEVLSAEPTSATFVPVHRPYLEVGTGIRYIPATPDSE